MQRVWCPSGIAETPDQARFVLYGELKSQTLRTFWAWFILSRLSIFLVSDCTPSFFRSVCGWRVLPGQVFGRKWRLFAIAKVDLSECDKIVCQRSFNWQSTAFVMRGLRVRISPLAFGCRPGCGWLSRIRFASNLLAGKSLTITTGGTRNRKYLRDSIGWKHFSLPPVAIGNRDSRGEVYVAGTGI